MNSCEALFGDLTGEKYKGDDLIYVSIEDEPEVVYKVVKSIFFRSLRRAYMVLLNMPTYRRLMKAISKSYR